MAGLLTMSQNLSQLPVLRQVSFLVAFAASIAIGVYVAFWSQKPEYLPISPGSSLSNSSEILDALSRSNIPHKIDNYTGQVMVVSDKVQEARLRLAQEGVISGEMPGFEILDKDQGFGESQFMKQTKYLRAIQGELSKTISKIQSINSARVQIAMPKQSSFVGIQSKPSASVFVDVYAGRPLSSNQVSAIVNLVATSVPGLAPADVSVIDQNGALLTNYGDGNMMIANENLDYQNKIEGTYEQRILELLEPIVGLHRVKAKASAYIDFNIQEETKENFDPEKTVLRSEQTSNESRGGAGAAGVPGALANQAPNVTSGAGDLGTNNSERQQATKNYEVNRSIQHLKSAPGKLKKLSIAVLVDDKLTFNEQGVIESRTPLTETEISSLTTLVKDAVGYDESRGDKLSVINVAFAPAPPAPVEPPVAWTDSPWLPVLIKQGLAGGLILLMLFLVIRPMFRGLSQSGGVMVSNEKELAAIKQAQLDVAEKEQKLAEAEFNLRKEKNQIKMIQELVNDDPRRVAQVVKNWVSDGGEG
jgi:flagellar M-ring protein FliF